MTKITNNTLHPNLKAALASLDLHLEDELALYRRQRRTSTMMPSSRSVKVAPIEHLDNLPQPAAQPLLSLEPELPAEITTPEAQDSPQTEYLASSAQLLEEIEDAVAEAPEPKPASDGLLTPLGVGSMLLLLLSSASVGYLVMNPNVASRLGLSRPSTSVATSPSAAAPVASPTGVPSPNLAVNELERLDANSIPRLTPQAAERSPIPTLPPSPAATKTTPSGTTNPALISGSPRLSDALGIPATSNPLPVPASPVSPTTSSSPQTSPQTNPQVSPSPQTSPARRRTPFFVVLVDYTDDRSLAQARTVIPEAYLEEIPDQGTKIQMGAFLSENEAKALVDQLRQRGITATIYRP